MPSPSQAHSHLRYPLTAILGSAGNVRVLRALITAPSPQSASQLAAAAGLTPQGSRLVLETLVRHRLVTLYGSDRTRLYTLNVAHPLASALAAMFQEEQHRWSGLLDSIRGVLESHGTAVSAAWFYGSVARGEDSPESDLDLAVIVRSHGVADQIREDLMPLEDLQQVHVSLTALTPGELAALPDDDPWWSDIVRDGRVLKGAAPDQVRRRIVKTAA